MRALRNWRHHQFNLNVSIPEIWHKAEYLDLLDDDKERTKSCLKSSSKASDISTDRESGDSKIDNCVYITIYLQLCTYASAPQSKAVAKLFADFWRVLLHFPFFQSMQGYQ